MTSEQQGPTDEVEGHGLRLPPEDETAGGGDDRGGRIPDDTEGHGWHHAQDTEAVDDDRGSKLPGDTEGHIGRHLQDPEATDEDQVGDDTEGHYRH